MSISLNRDLGKYGKSNIRGLENLFMVWLWQRKKKKKKKKKKKDMSGYNHIVGIEKVMMTHR